MPGRRIRIGWSGTPSWFSGASDNTLTAVPGTSTGNIAAVAEAISPPNTNTGSDQASIMTAWGSVACDTDHKALLSVANGGHNDWAGNETYKLLLTAESCAWERVTRRSTASDPTQAFNASIARGDGSRAADHAYSNRQYANGRVYMTAGCAYAGSLGYETTEVWYWAEADIGNGRLGYTNLGLAGTCNGSDPALVESNNAYDPIGGKVWHIPQNASSPNDSYWSVDVSTDAITTYTVGLPYNFTAAWVVCIPALRILLGRGDVDHSNALYRLDLTNPSGGWTSCTESGTPRSVAQDGAVFHAAAGSNGKVYVWPATGGTTIYTLTIPASADGTYAWSSASLAGSAPTQTINGTHKKFGIFEDFYGRCMLVFVTSVTNAVYFVKVATGGL